MAAIIPGSNISGNNKRSIHAAIREKLTGELATMNAAAGDRLLGNMEALKADIVASVRKHSAERPAVVHSFLEPRGEIQLDASQGKDPQAFYKTRTGLWVYDGFKTRVVAKAKSVENLDAGTLLVYDLAKNAYDREIKPELPEGHVFDESDLCARIQQMIEKQPNGEAGDLLNNGYANIFYLAGCVVGVDWSAGDREWSVGTWGLDGVSWSAGIRVFSRN